MTHHNLVRKCFPMHQAMKIQDGQGDGVPKSMSRIGGGGLVKVLNLRV